MILANTKHPTNAAYNLTEKAGKAKAKTGWLSSDEICQTWTLPR